MSMQTMISILQRALLDSEMFWKEETQKETDVKSFIQAFVLPVVVLTAVVSGLLTMLFGYRIPMLGVIRPGLSDMLIQMVGMVVLYILSLLILGWVAAYLAKLFGGKEDFSQAVKMIFRISVPSLLGQILGTLPYVGWIIALGLGLYSLVLLYRAIPVFLNVSLENRVKHFILFMISAFVVSVVLNMTVGRLFVPHDMLNQMRSDTLSQGGIPAETGRSISG